MAAPRRRRLSAAGLAAALCTLVAPAGSAESVPALTTAPESPATARITLTSVTPVIDGNDGTARIRGRITNTTSTPLTRPTISAVPATIEPGRAALAQWADGQEQQTGTALDTERLRGDLAPGASATFTLTLDGEDILPGRTWGAAPVSIQTTGAAVHTFVGIQRAKEYEPLRLVWGVPVTLPASNRLFDSPGRERTTAWSRAVGPDSDLARLTSSPPAPGDLWLVDPLLLPQGLEDHLSGASETEQDLRTARADAIREVLVPERTAILPEADADIAAAAGSSTARDLVRPRVTGAQEVAAEMDARADIAWPADGILADDRLSALQSIYGRAPTVIAPSPALGASPMTPHAAQTTDQGTPLLLSDPQLSALAGSVRTNADAVLAGQRLVAESAAIIGEAPGTPRAVVVLPDRGSRVEPGPYERLRDVVSDIPWAQPGAVPRTTPTTSPVDVPSTVADAIQRAKGDPDPTLPPGPLLTPERSQRLLADVEARRSFASVRSDAATWSPFVAAGQEQLTSARWRSSRWHFGQLDARLHQDVNLTRRDLTVASSDVNFFADTGRLQITVENHTDVELQNLTVRLTPQTHILRIDTEPEPITIGPHSRRTVTVQATALAGGRVPVTVDVTNPEGQTLSTPATLRARVSPTGNWIYWGIGGAAAALLTFGTWRSVRRPKSPARTKGTSA